MKAKKLNFNFFLWSKSMNIEFPDAWTEIVIFFLSLASYFVLIHTLPLIMSRLIYIFLSFFKQNQNTKKNPPTDNLLLHHS